MISAPSPFSTTTTTSSTTDTFSFAGSVLIPDLMISEPNPSLIPHTGCRCGLKESAHI